MVKLLLNKNSVITGCLKGIGFDTLNLFAEHGSNIFACAQYKTEEFESHIEALSNTYNVEIIPVYFDLSDNDQIKSGMKTILSSKKRIDALINIAGMTQNSNFHMTILESMKKLFDIDFFSQITIMQYISKIMMKYNSGSIVSVASITGIDGNAGQVSYSAAKGALIVASKTLSIELGKYNIRVNTVSPGVINTDMTKSLSKDIFDSLLTDCRLKRPGEAKEVAESLLFLASDLSSYITGQNIRIDGGIGA